MLISSINWPVFHLGSRKPEVDGDIMYYSDTYITGGDNYSTQILIIDDKSLPGQTLGLRRLSITKKLKKLQGLALYFLADLIKVADSTQWFIDNHGLLFKYKKSTSCRLTCHSIAKIEHLQTGGILVHVSKIKQRFKMMFTPELGVRYAGLLEVHKGYILYGLFKGRFKTTWRKV